MRYTGTTMSICGGSGSDGGARLEIHKFMRLSELENTWDSHGCINAKVHFKWSKTTNGKWIPNLLAYISIKTAHLLWFWTFGWCQFGSYRDYYLEIINKIIRDFLIIIQLENVRFFDLRHTFTEIHDSPNNQTGHKFGFKSTSNEMFVQHDIWLVFVRCTIYSLDPSQTSYLPD